MCAALLEQCWPIDVLNPAGAIFDFVITIVDEAEVGVILAIRIAFIGMTGITGITGIITDASAKRFGITSGGAHATASLAFVFHRPIHSIAHVCLVVASCLKQGRPGDVTHPVGAMLNVPMTLGHK